MSYQDAGSICPCFLQGVVYGAVFAALLIFALAVTMAVYERRG